MITTGVVLAGGQSRRFGENKLLQTVDGRPLIERVITTLSSVVDDVVVSVSAKGPLISFPNARLVTDLTPGTGPLGGLQSAFAATKSDWLLVVAGDMPRMSADSLRALLEKRDSDVDAVIAQDQEGNVHPLAGCYRRSVSPFVDRCIEERAFAVKALISRIEKVEYLTLPTEDLLNINRPEDLAAYS